MTEHKNLKVNDCPDDSKILEAARILCEVDYPNERVSDDFALMAYALKSELAKSQPRILLDASDSDGDDDPFSIYLCSAGKHNYVLVEVNGKVDNSDHSCKVTPIESKDSSTLMSLFSRYCDYVVGDDDIGPADVTTFMLTEDPSIYKLDRVKDEQGKRYPRTADGINKFLSDMEALAKKYNLGISFEDCASKVSHDDLSDEDFVEATPLCYIYSDILSHVDFVGYDQEKLYKDLNN